MIGKTVVLTGATSGIGAVAALTLAARGATIVFTARDRLRGEATLARLRAVAPAAPHRVHYADLSSIAATKQAAAEIIATTTAIDILMNNAGMVETRRIVTGEGLELTFATNHMAYFVLTCALRDHLASDARIINTASVMHAHARLDFADLQLQRGYHWWRAYANSKLCNVLFTHELARRLAGGVRSANCFHPGFVASRFGATRGGALGLAVRTLKYFAISPHRGARTMLYLATAPAAAVGSGGYFVRCKRVAPSRAALDETAAATLWQRSAQIAGIDW